MAQSEQLDDSLSSSRKAQAEGVHLPRGNLDRGQRDATEPLRGQNGTPLIGAKIIGRVPRSRRVLSSVVLVHVL